MTSSARMLRSTGRGLGAGQLAPALAAGLLWLVAALVTGYWVLQIWGRTPLTPVVAMAGNPPISDAVAVGRVLGALPEAPAEAPVAPPFFSRFRLIGLVGQPSQGGAALISFDGQPPKPVAVGSVVEGELRLLSVGRRVVRLGAKADDPAAFELSLPEQKE